MLIKVLGIEVLRVSSYPKDTEYERRKQVAREYGLPLIRAILCARDDEPTDEAARRLWGEYQELRALGREVIEALTVPGVAMASARWDAFYAATGADQLGQYWPRSNPFATPDGEPEGLVALKAQCVALEKDVTSLTESNRALRRALNEHEQERQRKALELIDTRAKLTRAELDAAGLADKVRELEGDLAALGDQADGDRPASRYTPEQLASVDPEAQRQIDNGYLGRVGRSL